MRAVNLKINIQGVFNEMLQVLGALPPKQMEMFYSNPRFKGLKVKTHDHFIVIIILGPLHRYPENRIKKYLRPRASYSNRFSNRFHYPHVSGYTPVPSALTRFFLLSMRKIVCWRHFLCFVNVLSISKVDTLTRERLDPIVLR